MSEAKRAIPCREFVRNIQTGEYNFLFSQYDAQVMTAEEYDTPIGRSCKVIIALGKMQIVFDSNPRDGDPSGRPLEIGAVGEDRWYSPVRMAAFLRGEWTTYVKLEKHQDVQRYPGFETPGARKHTWESLIAFFVGDNYERKRKELEKWMVEDIARYRRQMDDYYAK